MNNKVSNYNWKVKGIFSIKLNADGRVDAAKKSHYCTKLANQGSSTSLKYHL